jgi:CRP-like cAMP-binding protein
VGNFFYIVKSGELTISFSSLQTPKILTKGDTFGELALIQKSRRSGTVMSNITTELYCLEGTWFRDILKKINSLDQNERNLLIRLISIFRGLSEIEISNIANSMIKCEFEDNELILADGDKSESLFIIKEGRVSCIKNNQEFKKLEDKDYFGESSILFQTKRSMSILSLKRTICYQITKNVLQETLGDNFRTILLKSICKESFASSKVMKNFCLDKYFEKVFDCFKVNNYKFSQVLFKAGEVAEENKKIVIVIQGSIINVNFYLPRTIQMRSLPIDVSYMGIYCYKIQCKNIFIQLDL